MVWDVKSRLGKMLWFRGELLEGLQLLHSQSVGEGMTGRQQSALGMLKAPTQLRTWKQTDTNCA